MVTSLDGNRVDFRDNLPKPKKTQNYVGLRVRGGGLRPCVYRGGRATTHVFLQNIARFRQFRMMACFRLLGVLQFLPFASTPSRTLSLP